MISSYLMSKIYELTNSNEDDMDPNQPRTQLDSHANMMVCNDHCHIFDSVYKRSTDVEPFDPSLGLSTKVPIVDVALAFELMLGAKIEPEKEKKEWSV